MVRRIYSILDLVAADLAMSGMLILAAHDQIAIRDFTDAVLAPGSRFAAHPSDYALVCLGWIDSQPEGRAMPDMHAFEIPETIITAASVLAAQPQGGA